MTTSQSLCNVLSTLDLNQSQVHRIVNLVQIWRKSNGDEWTVQRLKDLHQYFLRSTNGLPFSPKTWLSTSDRGLKGPFSALNGKSLRVKLAATRIYTLFQGRNGHYTERQLNKFHEAAFNTWTYAHDYPVNHRGQFVSALPIYAEKLVSNMPTLTVSKDHVKHFSMFSWSKEKRSPLGSMGSVSESDYGVWMSYDILNPTIRSMVSNCRTLGGQTGLSQYFSPFGVKERMKDTKHPEFLDQPIGDIGVIGRLGYIQEPGFKLRVVANPSRSIQICLEGLKQSVHQYINDVFGESDCTDDQQKGVTFAQNALAKGETVHSVDLSNATDLFPLDMTSSWLSVLSSKDKLTQESLNLFYKASKSYWFDPNSKSKERWRTGQPLGLGPSFFCFALSHHMLVHGCGVNLGMKFSHIKDHYRILGDDIVITDDSLAQAYRDKILSMGCKISEDKSMSSNKVAEFAGYIVTADKAYMLGKYRKISDNNFIDIAKSLGPKSIGLFRPRQKKVLKALGPVPEFINGGLGWNPKGLPLGPRIDYALKLGLLDDGEQLRRVINPLIRRREVKNSLHYDHSITPDRELLSESEVVEPVVDQTTVVSDAINLATSVPTDTSTLSEWPSSPRTGDPRRITSLPIWENKLQKNRAEAIQDLSSRLRKQSADSLDNPVTLESPVGSDQSAQTPLEGIGPSDPSIFDDSFFEEFERAMADPITPSDSPTNCTDSPSNEDENDNDLDNDYSVWVR